MKAIPYPYADVPGEQDPEVPGVTIQWVLGKNVNAPNFAMRVITLEPGASTPFHTHAWEHEIYVLEGEGAVKDKNGEVAVTEGACIFVEQNEVHSTRNTGDGLLRFICVVPWPEKL